MRRAASARRRYPRPRRALVTRLPRMRRLLGAFLRRRLRAAERPVDRVALLRGKLDLGSAVAHALDVRSRLLSMKDRREHEPIAVSVEQGERARLVAAHLVVRVIPDDRGVADAPMEVVLVRRQPLVELLKGLL